MMQVSAIRGKGRYFSVIFYSDSIIFLLDPGSFIVNSLYSSYLFTFFLFREFFLSYSVDITRTFKE
jgi:hypothetical protein